MCINNMKENYLITIDSLMKYEDDESKLSLKTVGDYYKKGKKHYIRYNETAATGFDGYTTTLKVADDSVTILRFGKKGLQSSMAIRRGKSSLWNYESDMGQLTLNVNGVSVNDRLSEEGQLSFEYSIDASGVFISDNKVDITIKEIN
jgi:uncharacterized beta-barrel protein YwiB (DUF1934 family)